MSSTIPFFCKGQKYGATITEYPYQTPAYLDIQLESSHLISLFEKKQSFELKEDRNNSKFPPIDPLDKMELYYAIGCAIFE